MDEEEKNKYISFFLNEGAIEYIIQMDNDNLENQLYEAKKYCEIPVKDAADLKNQLIDSDFLSIERNGQWEFSYITVLDNNGDEKKFSYCQANFDIINKWGYKCPYRYFQIIYSDDFIVRWMGYVLIGNPIFWLSTQNSVYRVTYFHKNLMVFPNVCYEKEFILGLSPKYLDNVVKKYHKCLRYYDPTFKLMEHEVGYKIIELEQYFHKGFFYKGLKYNYNEFKKANYYSWTKPSDCKKKEISELIDIKAENGLFKIEIINQTYPHIGYVYLDLDKLKIVHTEILSCEVDNGRSC